MWIVAALTLADELLPPLQDVAPGEQGEEGRRVRDVERRTFLQSHTCDHLQGVVRPGRSVSASSTIRLDHLKTRRQFGEQLWLRRAALGKRPEREDAQPAARTWVQTSTINMLETERETEEERFLMFQPGKCLYQGYKEL